jgi:hypothetical protein
MERMVWTRRDEWNFRAVGNQWVLGLERMEWMVRVKRAVWNFWTVGLVRLERMEWPQWAERN